MGVRNRTDRGEKKREGMGEEMMKTLNVIGWALGIVVWVSGIIKNNIETQILGVAIVVMFQTFKLENDISDIKKEESK